MLNYEGLQLRAALFTAIRSFFQSRHFLEVDTPIRQPILIPESTIVPLSSGDMYLQTSPELCMKRILARGCPQIFQICPCFRAEERGRRHLEEFIMLEWYRLDADYNDLMDDCRELLRHVVVSLTADHRFTHIIGKSCFGSMDLSRPWQHLSVEEAFDAYCPMSLSEAMAGNVFDEMIVDHIEPELGCSVPGVLLDYPAEYGTLARKKATEPQVVERFELYVKGMELANGFSELTDPVEQRQRFVEEIERIRLDQDRQAEMPDRFLDDLDSIDTAAGIAFGIDRFLMLLMSADSIGDVVSFEPHDW